MFTPILFVTLVHSEYIDLQEVIGNGNFGLCQPRASATTNNDYLSLSLSLSYTHTQRLTFFVSDRFNQRADLGQPVARRPLQPRRLAALLGRDVLATVLCRSATMMGVRMLLIRASCKIVALSMSSCLALGCSTGDSNRGKVRNGNGERSRVVYAVRSVPVGKHRGLVLLLCGGKYNVLGLRSDQ